MSGMAHKMFSSNKPFSAITVQLDRMTGDNHEVEDLADIIELIEAIRLQPGGPAEAARAIRKKLKYGRPHQQLRALVILDALISNAGTRFQQHFADEMLLERLRVCATDQTTDARVRRRCQILFQHWAKEYKSVAGMDRITNLERQVPTRKRPITQQQSRVLRETEPQPNEDPFNHDDDDAEPPSRPSQPLPNPQRPQSHFSSSNNTLPNSQPYSLSSALRLGKKSIRDRTTRKSSTSQPGQFNLEKAKPMILETIASSSVASTNLMNSLKLIDREQRRVSDDPVTRDRFDTCKRLRRQILRYIQHIESEQWLGSLIQANDALIEALMAYEILDKSIEDDSDSDDAWQDARHILSDSERSPPQSPAGLSRDLTKMSLGGGRSSTSTVASTSPSPRLPRLPALPKEAPSPQNPLPGGAEDSDDPFADSNEVGTDLPGRTWRDV